MSVHFRPVSIIRLLSEGTIEEGMHEIAQDKLDLEQKITSNEGQCLDFPFFYLISKRSFTCRE